MRLSTLSSPVKQQEITVDNDINFYRIGEHIQAKFRELSMKGMNEVDFWKAIAEKANEQIEAQKRLKECYELNKNSA